MLIISAQSIQKNHSLIDVSKNSVLDNGFVILSEIIPNDILPILKREVIDARFNIFENINKIKKILDSNPNITDEDLINNNSVKVAAVSRNGYKPKPYNDILWMPNFQKFLSNSVLTDLIETLLDFNVRISQIHPKIIFHKSENQRKTFIDNMGQSRVDAGDGNLRDYHTDWPHDPTASGGGDPGKNWGCMNMPFPDILMTLVCIFFITDSTENGGTWIVPGSHKDTRNPRNPLDNIDPLSPINGEVQLKINAGSVLVMDSRLWHSSPLHNPFQEPRVAVVTRWNPWWMAVDDYAPNSMFNVSCRPIPFCEFQKLPTTLKPYLKHLCRDIPQTIDPRILNRAERASNYLKNRHLIL
jgi:ectoine hydroxylase-related dioxygenase (phytanoyl-CoA dioxygenase family)